MPDDIVSSLQQCDTLGDLYKLLGSRPVAEIEQLCASFPIETLGLDWKSAEDDFSNYNYKTFEIIIALAQTLVSYDHLLQSQPELQLPPSLPAKGCAETLLSKLIPFISSQWDVDMAYGLRDRLYDLAMELLKANRDRDALHCLLASRPSLKEDHEFWICACRFNIALATKNREDRQSAIESANDIISGRTAVPAKYVEGARKMLETLDSE